MNHSSLAETPWPCPPFEWPKPPERATWRGRPSSQRADWRKAAFINYPDARKVIEDAWSYVAYCILFKRSFCMLIKGEGGSGKTRLTEELERHINAHYNRVDPEKTIVSALRLEKLPPDCKTPEICWAILRALGDPAPELRKKPTIVEQTAGLIGECEVRAILLDNIQDVPVARGPKGIMEVGSTFRDLIDGTKLLWMFLGTQKADEVINSDIQIIKRVKYHAELPYFSSTGRGAKVYLRLLDRFDEWIPLAETNKEFLRTNSGRIHIGTEGVLDRIVDLFDHSSMYAVKDGRESFMLRDFESAFSHLMGRQHVNPFAPGFTMRRLNKVGEPFVTMKSGATTKRK